MTASTSPVTGIGPEMTRTAQGFADLAAFLEGNPDAPVPYNPVQYASAPAGSDEERKAYVDAFAARHGVTARWTEGRYEAALVFGAVTYVVHFCRARYLEDSEARNSYRSNIKVAA